jgi:hypothetical protein
MRLVESGPVHVPQIALFVTSIVLHLAALVDVGSRLRTPIPCR